MAHVKESIGIRASADAVWSLLGDPGRIEEWHPYVARSALNAAGEAAPSSTGARSRSASSTTPTADRSCVYEITEGLSAIRGYVGRFAVVEQGDRSVVWWEGDFQVEDPAKETAIVEQTRQTFRAGLEGLRERIESQPA